MIKGFGILEMLITLSLSLGILTVIIAQAAESGRMAKKITSNQERLEAIFHTVDTIKSDLNKCGMRLQEACKLFNIACFECTAGGFKMNYGLADEVLLEKATLGQRTLKIAKNDFFKKDQVVLVYNPEGQMWELNEIEDLLGSALVLKNPLQNDFLSTSQVLALKKVEYKFYPAQHVLKRKTDKGNFQPLLEEVSDFYVTFFPDANSVLYRIEVNKKEQIRGYIFLLNLVQP
jgi:type II secretory pathway pseudopilin PulG